MKKLIFTLIAVFLLTSCTINIGESKRKEPIKTQVVYRFMHSSISGEYFFFQEHDCIIESNNPIKVIKFDWDYKPGDLCIDYLYIKYTDGADTLTKKVWHGDLRPLRVSLISTTELN